MADGRTAPVCDGLGFPQEDCTTLPWTNVVLQLSPTTLRLSKASLVPKAGFSVHSEALPFLYDCC